MSRYGAWRNRLSYLKHQLFESFSVLCLFDAVPVYSEKLHAVFCKYSGSFKLHRKIKSRLSSETCKKSVRLLFFDYAAYSLCCQRLYVYLVCNIGVSHYRGRVAVDKYGFNSFFFDCLAGLCARIVKLGCLSYDYRTGTDYHYLFKFTVLWHCFPPSSL